jgi:O-antigen/teichoic acid export membrane protein
VKRLISLGLRFSGSGLTLLTTVILTRKWDLESTGKFFLFYSLYRVISGFAASVFVRRTIRDVAKADPTEWQTLGYQIFNDKVMFFLAVLLSAFPIAFILSELNWVSPVTPLVLISALMMLSLQFASSMLQGTFNSNESIFVEYILVPAIFLISLLLVPTTISPTYCHVFALLLSCFLTFIFFFKHISFSRLSVKLPKIEAEDYTFIGTRVVNVIQNNVIMLISPFVLSNSQIGIVGVLLRFYTVSNSVLEGMSSNYSPRFSKAFHNGNHEKLLKLFKESQLYSVISYVPILLTYVFLGSYISRFMNLQGQIENLLIGIGFIGLVNVFTNLSGAMLLVSHQQKAVLQVYIISLVVLICLYWPMVSLLSLWGFVIAFGAYQIVKQGMLYLKGKHLLKSMTEP